MLAIYVTLAPQILAKRRPDDGILSMSQPVYSARLHCTNNQYENKVLLPRCIGGLWAMYYKIDGSNVRLAGSMHFVPAGAMVPQWIMDAYQWSEDVFIEANKDDLRTDGFLPLGQSSETS